MGVCRKVFNVAMWFICDSTELTEIWVGIFYVDNHWGEAIILIESEKHARISCPDSHGF